MKRTPEFFASFKSLFESEKKRLLFSNRFVSADFAVQADELMDEVDFTAFELENQMRLRLLNRESLYLKKVEEALARIQAGSFGQCGDCEEDIEPKRLEARPTTTLCISCKEHEERLEQIHIDGHSSKSMGVARTRLA